MELKTNYQYTYFIYPYAIKKESYNSYIKGLMKNKKFDIKFFDGFKDIELYDYFLPSIKKNYFQNFTFSKEKLSLFNKLSFSNRKRILTNQESITFEYKIDDEYQGKTGEAEGIFFTINKIRLICFKTGICFLLIKTHIEETNNFSNILDFNYKFSNLKFEANNLKNINNIKIQTNKFSNMQQLSEFIEKIIGTKIINREIDIDENSFQIYTYACIDSKYWNKSDNFKNIEKEFLKFSEVAPSSSNEFKEFEKMNVIANSNFMRLRINQKCCALICSSTENANYTKLPVNYENQYLYTYIFALHQRVYLKKVNRDLKNKKDNEEQIKKMVEIMNDVLETEITQDSLGEKIYKRCREKFNIDDLYKDLKNKYDIFYKKAKIEKYTKITSILITIMTLCLLVSISNLLAWRYFE